MSNGTERDEPGQRSEGTGPAESGRPSSDPVWPVWGGGAAEPAVADAPVDEPPADAPTDVEADASGPASTGSDPDEPSAAEPSDADPADAGPAVDEAVSQASADGEDAGVPVAGVQA